MVETEILRVFPNHLSLYQSFLTSANLSHRSGFLESLFPVAIFNWNISSNHGLQLSTGVVVKQGEANKFKNKSIVKVSSFLHI